MYKPFQKEKAYILNYVLAPSYATWDKVSNFFSPRTYGMWDVGADGRITGATPKMGYPPLPGGIKGAGSLVKASNSFSKHSLIRMQERGISKGMVRTTINKGQKFYDPLNSSINYVLPQGFASGKNILVGTNPLTGEVTTVIRSSKNLIKPRFIK